MLSGLSPTACARLAHAPHYLTFLYPTFAMARQPSRLSANIHTSPSSSRSHTLTTDSTRGASSSKTRSIPYFEEWPTEALQAEVKKYGFKVSRKRTTLIDRLKAVYEALDRSEVEYEVPIANGEVAEPRVDAGVQSRRQLVLPDAAEVEVKGKGRGRKSDPFVLDDEESYSSDSSSVAQPNETEVGDYTAQLEREALSATDGSDSDLPLSTSALPQKPRRGRPPRSSSPSSSSTDIPLSTLTQPPIVPPAALANTLTTAIRSTPHLWHRILRYEPISFDELVSIATVHGLAMDTGRSKDALRTWLDSQCICFYSNDLTGPRSRH